MMAKPVSIQGRPRRLQEHLSRRQAQPLVNRHVIIFSKRTRELMRCRGLTTRDENPLPTEVQLVGTDYFPEYRKRFFSSSAERRIFTGDFSSEPASRYCWMN